MSEIIFKRDRVIKTTETQEVELHIPDTIYFLVLRRTYRDGHQSLETYTFHDALPFFDKSADVTEINVLYVRRFDNGREVLYWNTQECTVLSSKREYEAVP